ncbi:hypothetical protein EVAR_50362_1 [Eumeta japonica]|uniref:Uncharacterized protein n=1 Tax=Eumeta variegata TaxID=151549 RepID=A0A4C1Y0Z9_EUMVA|nr:hypothetical protein EVAR_50362_1 [Eumeta japonica]
MSMRAVEKRMATAAHGHSQPQRSHSYVARLLNRSTLFSCRLHSQSSLRSPLIRTARRGADMVHRRRWRRDRAVIAQGNIEGSPNGQRSAAPDANGRKAASAVRNTRLLIASRASIGVHYRSKNGKRLQLTKMSERGLRSASEPPLDLRVGMRFVSRRSGPETNMIPDWRRGRAGPNSDTELKSRAGPKSQSRWT